MDESAKGRGPEVLDYGRPIGRKATELLAVRLFASLSSLLGVLISPFAILATVGSLYSGDTSFKVFAWTSLMGALALLLIGNYLKPPPRNSSGGGILRRKRR
jgi:hypothetical protein